MAPLLARVVYAVVQLPLLTTALACLLYVGLFAPVALRQKLAGVASRYGSNALSAVAMGLIAIYGILLAWYMSLPNFAGEVEPVVASLSWLTATGQPLYHGLEDATRYSILYGPIVFLANGLVMQLLGPSIFSAKLAGALSGATSMLFLFLALRAVLSRRHALWACGYAVLLYFFHGPFSYLSRPDPFLLTASSFALLCALRAPRYLALLGLAAAIAWGIDLKIHAPVYFIVPIVLCAQRLGWRATSFALFGALVLSTLPFVLFENISARNYGLWLVEATRHGLDFATFQKTARFGFFLLIPIALLTGRGSVRRDARHATTVLLGATLLSFLGVLLFASKPGAGLNHLLPFIPIALYASARMAREVEFRPEAPSLRWPRVAGLLACATTAILFGLFIEGKCVQRLNGSATEGHRVLADIQSIMDAHPDDSIGMAYGGEGASYDLTFYRPSLVFAGQPLLLDVISVMESQRSRRLLPETTYQALDRGDIRIWMVPKGHSPFVKRNWYPPHSEVFPDDFRSLLARRYEHRGTTEFFDLWFYDGVAAELLELTPANTLMR